MIIIFIYLRDGNTYGDSGIILLYAMVGFSVLFVFLAVEPFWKPSLNPHCLLKQY
ncbi:hypothetical protein [Microcystis aeruginosa]|uniref:hypothetical protein n=1 Tax=Microcystis aeruginosa TaxID=1126 RepID=UPI000A7C2793|nr:hypothetical protein [Microcystis aeruginosa]